MKREEYKLESLPSGCTFYAPLVQNDLTDHVSGVSPTQGAAQVSFDSGMDAWRFVTTYGGQFGLIYNIIGVNVYTQPYAYTMVADVYVNSFSGTCDVLTIGSATNNTSAAIIETHRFTGFTTSAWHRLVQTLDNTVVKFYIDGSLVRTSDTTAFAVLSPSSWTDPDRQNNLVIGGGFWNYSYNAYFKNVMILNRALTAQEVAAL